MINGTTIINTDHDTTDSNTSMNPTSNTVAYYTSRYEIRCEKCDGTGYQQRTDGVWVVCPICEGSGRQKCKCAPTEPLYPPYNPLKPTYWESLPSYTEPPNYRKHIITC